MRRYCILLFTLLCVHTYAQDKHALYKSDSLYAKGVELYKLKKYRDAIPLFTESDRIDKAELDSTSNRRDYSAMWLASCYKNIGEIEIAKKIYYPIYDEPVDRRLTIKSDSLGFIVSSMDSIKDKISLTQQVLEIENTLLGATHQYTANTVLNLAIYHVLNDDIDNVINSFHEILNIAQLNPVIYFPEEALISLFGYILSNDDRIKNFDYDAELDKMIYIASLSKAEKENTIWSALINAKFNFLQAQKKIEQSYQLVDIAYQDILSTEVINHNLFEISSLLGSSLFQKYTLSNNENEKSLIHEKRLSIYNSMLDISEDIWGNESFQYASTIYKIANLYLRTGPKLDLPYGKYLLIKSFDIITNSSIILSNPFDVISLIKDSRIPFDVANANAQFVSYLQTVINLISSTYTFIDISELKEILADSISSYRNIDGTLESINIYSELIDEAAGNPNNTINYLKKRAHGYRMINEYDNSLKDYLLVDSIYENQIATDTFFLNRDVRNQVKKDISDMYLKLADTTNFYKYRNIYCSLTETLINDFILDKTIYTQTDDDYKLEIILDYANIFYGVPNDLSTDYERSIKYIQLLLEILPNMNPVLSSRYSYERQGYAVLARIYILKYDFLNSYKYITKLINESHKNQDTDGYIWGLDLLSSLYENVSVEPELALNYKLQACETLSDALVHNRNYMLKEAYQTSFDMMRMEWNKCIELYEYIGDEQGVEKCYNLLFNYLKLLEGEDSAYYAQTKMEWFLYHQIPYLRRIKKDISTASACCDSLAEYYEKNRHLLIDSPYWSYLDIGREYYYCGDTISANKYYDLYENELKKLSPDEYSSHIEYIKLLDTRADLYGYGTKQKIDYLKDIEPLYENIAEKYPREYIYFLRGIAAELEWYGDKNEEIEYCKKILSLFPDNLTLNRLVACYHEIGQYAQIIPLFDALSRQTREEVLDSFKSQPGEFRERMWKSYFEIPFNLGESLADKYLDQISTTTLYDNLLMRKNFLLNASISAENLIKTEGDSLLLAKYDRMQILKRFLDSNQESFDNMGHLISREQAENLVNRFGSEIMTRAGILGDYTASLFINWESVQKELTEDDVAIEFSKYTSLDGDVAYAALILSHTGQPFFCPLFCEIELEYIPESQRYNTDRLYNLIWEPLEEYIREKKKIFFSPDGLLYNIAIESVPNGKNEILSDIYSTYRLSSTRELVSLNGKAHIQNAILYGGLKYSADIQVLADDIEKYPNVNTRDLEFFNVADSLNLRSGVHELPETKIEVENINNSLKDLKIQTRVLTDIDGTEASFKDLSSKSINVLHIATHGFYWTETEALQRNNLDFLMLKNGQVPNYVEDKALTRSGLLFSGAINALMGKPIPENAEDGILTAKEIAGLDLRGLDLVVLSACQTGLGEITGDGVFGLQRGFKKAGANSLMMSLWKVDDKATQILMSRFYENLIAGKSKYESLCDAQRYVREYEQEVEVSIPSNYSNHRPVTAREREQFQKNELKEKQYKIVRPYQDPKYWAAFILLDGIN